MKCYTQSDNGSHSGVKTNVASAELIQNLEEISKIKKGLPARSRGYCSELGLYVQMREADGMARLQAGGKFRSRINLWRDSPTDFWQVKKYRTGDWERLVQPTLELARWLEVRRGVGNEAKSEFRYAIKKFRRTSRILLPEGIGSFSVDSILGRIVTMYPGSSGNWSDDMVQDVETRLRSYIDSNPDQAAAWEALANVYVPRDRFKDALCAIEEASRIAPDWADFHFEAGGIYIAAIKNALTPAGQLDDSIAGCTLDTLQCSYEDARESCVKHFRAILESRCFFSESDKMKVRQALSWCESTPMINVYEKLPMTSELNLPDDSSTHEHSPNNEEPLNRFQGHFGMFVLDQAVRLILKNVREDSIWTTDKVGIPTHTISS